MRDTGPAHRAVLACALLAVLALAGCSGSGDDTAADRSTPTPTATTPTVAPQPEGADGVTFAIRNWDEHADDAAVLSWKQALEAASASVNRKKVLPAFQRGFTARGFRVILPTIKQAWPHGWTVPARATVDVARSTVSGDRATVVACLWGETIAFRTKQGSFVQADGTRKWKRTVSQLVRSGGTWKVAQYTVKGRCNLEEPS